MRIGATGGAEGARKAEVGELQSAGAVDEDVLRLEVPKDASLYV